LTSDNFAWHSGLHQKLLAGFLADGIEDVGERWLGPRCT
jgi:hypothetical protein